MSSDAPKRFCVVGAGMGQAQVFAAGDDARMVAARDGAAKAVAA